MIDRASNSASLASSSFGLLFFQEKSSSERGFLFVRFKMRSLVNARRGTRVQARTIQHHVAGCTSHLRPLVSGFMAATLLTLNMSDASAAGSMVLTGPARVVDGDTLVIDKERIRLFGIDAPESKQLCRLGREPPPRGLGMTVSYSQQKQARC